MTYILGITRPVGFNMAAVLLKEGKIVAAAEEERFTRIKHARNMFPMHAINYCIQEAGITIEEVDKIAVGGLSRIHTALKQGSYLLAHPWQPLFYRIIKECWHELAKTEQNFPNKKIGYFSHHITHAASAHYVSGFKESNILSLDGLGETESGLLAVGEKEHIRTIKTYDWSQSLGELYSYFTWFLGFRKHIDEWKVMGLSSYGRPLYQSGNIIKFRKNDYYIPQFPRFLDMFRSIAHHTKNKTKIKIDQWFTQMFGKRRMPGDEITRREYDIAATAQMLYEQAFLLLARKLYSKTGLTRFALAGGCSLNCVANGILYQQDYCKELFVQPAANDAGTALGAAILAAKDLGVRKFEPMTHTYLGPSFSDEQIAECLKRYGLQYTQVDDIAGKCAELLSNHKLIGWFQGRMEFGPRALGNRSILANPTRIEAKNKVNQCVKHREPWRPFAPSVIDRAAYEYFENAKPSPFMILNFRVRQEKWKEIPAVVHIDGTARVQTVSKETNPLYYRLISKFEAYSGHPVLLNTSFNDNEEPIVCTPDDAIKTFLKTGLDYLAIGNYLVDKHN